MIDKDEAIRLLRKEVANKGEDYIYVNPERDVCMYFHANQPSCIVGHVIAGTEWENKVNTVRFNTIGVYGLFDHIHGMMDTEAMAVLNAAQHAQDSKHSWGEALRRAEDKYRQLGGTE